MALGGAVAQGSGGINAPAHRDKPYVVLVSFDGFKPEYLDRSPLPSFARVAREGVRSAGMIGVYPSKTFPNHYAIVTGMYAESHGIVGNRFFDPQRNATYALGDTSAVTDGSWYRGEPLWVAAEKQGMVAASFFWVGSEAAIGGVRPSIWKRYDTRVRSERRVDSVLAWLALPAERRPHFITLYFSVVDAAGHEHGPGAAPVDSAARQADGALGRLLDGLDRLPDVRDRAYLVLVSDHGMSETSPAWHAALDTLIDLNGVQIAEAGALANLHVEGGMARARVLRDSINRRMKFGRAYVRGDLPAHLHYNRDPRIGDLVVVMDDRWQVGRANRPARAGGNHGWDPTFPSMHALFLARGPDIPAGRAIPSFASVDLYPWMAGALGLRPAPGIDGERGRLSRLIAGAERVP